VAEAPIRITLVRHGQSEANRVQRWQGQGDSPLSELGFEQARRVGERLRGLRFDRVISSDLSRAKETARATGHVFEELVEWREFDVGRWEGLTREEVEERFPEELSRLKSGEDIPLGGGERYSDFSARIDAALSRLVRELAPGTDVLIVCHGGVISTLLAGQLGLRKRGRWPFARVSNTSITELELNRERVALRVYNDTAHLSDMSRWPLTEDVTGCVALVADDAAVGLGEFSERYDARESGGHAHASLSRLSQAVLGPAGAVSGREAAELVGATVLELAEAHAEERVALALTAPFIHAFATDALWLDGSSGVELSPPSPSALCHVAPFNGRPLVLDYAVSPVRER
jgi:broad specificity phosphatase PhoE